MRKYLFADDMQGHKNSQHQNASMVVASLQDCVIASSKWCSSKRLQLNAKKTELLWFGSVTELRKVDPALTVGTDRCNSISRRRPGSRSLLRFSSHDASTTWPESPGPASSIFVVYDRYDAVLEAM